MSNTSPQKPALIVPALRQDLRLLDTNSSDGHCLIYDPLAHRYHEVDRDTLEVIRHWEANLSLEVFALRLSKQLGRQVSESDVRQIVQTFDNAGLLVEPMGGWKSRHQALERSRHGAFMWLLHNYLFFRVPLFHPDAFLKRMLPVADFFTSRFALYTLFVIGVVGIYLTTRQWEAFTGTFLHFFSLEGAAAYAITLFLVKVLHEFGHGFAASRFGCRVPTMGIAFVVLTPMLYTDVTDAWRLKSRREKLIIGGAGIMVELYIAIIATFLWAVLPEGLWKSAAFLTATISWVSSIVINISPLMRFDGYYLLADYWGISNLQPRAFALMRWYIREALFGLQVPCPEDFSRRRRLMVLTYAIITAIYRLSLFIGIALLVYHFAFKVLGILLFLVEIVWFVLLPVWKEIKTWWAMREKIVARSRYKYSFAAIAATVLVISVPLPHRLEFPGIVEPVIAQTVSAPYSGLVAQALIKNGDKVRAGDPLFTLQSPKLEADLKSAQLRLQALNERYARRTVDQLDRETTLVIEKGIEKAIETLHGLDRQRKDLNLRATVDGLVHDVPTDVHVGRWIQRGEPLAIVVADQGNQIRGYLPEEYVPYIPQNAKGVFIPDSLLEKSLDVVLQKVADTSAPAIDLAYLTSANGGSIAVEQSRDRGSVPVEAQYPILMAVNGADRATSSVLRGVVRIDATPESFLTRVVKRAAAILIRESGF